MVVVMVAVGALGYALLWARYVFAHISSLVAFIHIFHHMYVLTQQSAASNRSRAVR